MTKQTRPVIKTYYESGDIPTQGQYQNLIDSSLNLSDEGTEIA